MKKSFAVIFIIMTFLFVAGISKIEAGWGPQYSHTVPVNSNFSVCFLPGVSGNHIIEFLNQSNIYNGGVMLSYWGSSFDPGNWHYWATSDVLSRARQQNLYAGSNDIIFKFTFVNIQAVPVTFYWRFFTD
jgi:hypothetical protein